MQRQSSIDILFVVVEQLQVKNGSYCTRLGPLRYVTNQQRRRDD
jgi:hypothetical protein